MELSPKKILSNRTLMHIFLFTVAGSQLWHHRKKNRGARLTDLALFFLMMTKSKNKFQTRSCWKRSIIDFRTVTHGTMKSYRFKSLIQIFMNHCFHKILSKEFLVQRSGISEKNKRKNVTNYFCPSL